jgi:hypothetical protein
MAVCQNHLAIEGEVNVIAERLFSKIQFDFIHKTPAPILAGLNGLHDRVLRVMKVFSGVLVFRRVAATHMTTLHAEAQMYPGVAGFQTLLAAVRSAWLDVVNMIQMCASVHFPIVHYRSERVISRGDECPPFD